MVPSNMGKLWSVLRQCKLLQVFGLNKQPLGKYKNLMHIMTLKNEINIYKQEDKILANTKLLGFYFC